MRDGDRKEQGFWGILALTVMPEEKGERNKKCPAFAGHRIYTPLWRNAIPHSVFNTDARL